MAITSRYTRLLLLVSALVSSVSASPLGPVLIRDSQCPANTQSCPSSLPNNFCCSKGTSCIPLAENTTVLCCPDGQTCEKIQPITCDINQQDPSKNQNSPIKTSVFNVSLPKCGTDLCCPFGYSCSDDNTQCLKNSDQSIYPGRASRPAKPSQKDPSQKTGSQKTAPQKTASQTSAFQKTTSPASATSATTPATTAPTSANSSSSPVSSLVATSVTTTPASLRTEESTAPSVTSAPYPSPATNASSETPKPSSSKSSSSKTVPIVGGVLGGCAVLGAIVFFCIRHNRRSNDDELEKPGIKKIKHLGPNTQGTSIMVSDPIVQPNLYRADFIRKSPSIHSSVSQRPPQIVLTHTNASQRFSIPNPFNSPSPSNSSPTSCGGSIISDDGRDARTGVVESRSRLTPIRAMKASSTRVYPQDIPTGSSSDSMDLFADPFMNSNYETRQKHTTTFTDLMVEAQLGNVHRGEPFLPSGNRI